MGKILIWIPFHQLHLGNAAANDVIGSNGCYAELTSSDALARAPPDQPKHSTLENQGRVTELSLSCVFKAPMWRITLLKDMLEKKWTVISRINSSQDLPFQGMV